MTIKLKDGSEGIATVRSLGVSSGQVAVVQPLPHVLAGWWTRTIGHVSLLGATIVVLLGIGIAYVMQSNRARAADEVCEKVRDRIDSALNRGRCGLWDWDIGRGRIYWSDSMYELLGYERQDEFLSFGEVNTHDPSRGSGSLHAGRAARLRQPPRSSITSSASAASAAIGCGCAPAPS